MKKYFFFDIDGTLTMNLAGECSESTGEAVRLLQKKGHFVSIATGRLQADAWEVAQSLGISSLVSDGGESLTVDGKLLYQRGLPLAACQTFFSSVDRKRFPFAVAPYNRKVRLASSFLYEEKVTDRYYETTVVGDKAFETFERIHKIFVACRREEVKDVPLGDLPHVWFRDGTLLVEPTHKEKGIFDFLERFSVPHGDVIVFGDGLNDVSMFQQGWFSVAMGNGKASLKSVADYVTDRVDCDGIYNACRRFGWI